MYVFGRRLLYPDKNLIDYDICWNEKIKNVHSWNQLTFIWSFGIQAWECEHEQHLHSITLPPPAKRVKRDPDQSSNLTQQIQTHQQKCVGNTIQTDSTEEQTDKI